jgi:hypothetical protein
MNLLLFYPFYFILKKNEESFKKLKKELEVILFRSFAKEF